MSKPTRPVGAPRKEIDYDELEKLCGIQCTVQEICGWFDISEDTLDRRIKEKYGVNFAEFFAQKRVTGKISLRRKMYQQAMNDGGAMAIFLSKQKTWLDFNDNVKQTNVEEMSEEGKALTEELKKLISKK